MAKSSRAVHRGKAGSGKTKKSTRKSVTALTHEPHQDPKTGRKPGAFTKNDPRINRTIPGPGRPPGRFARRCRKILASKKTWKAVRRIVQNEDNPMMKGMWGVLADRGHGKISSEVSLSLPQGTDDEGNTVDATFLLIGKIDAMAKRKEKAQEKK